MPTPDKHFRREDSHYREAIIGQALRDFHDHGIKGVTMSQIAEELHISKRTLYEVYASKEELVTDCLQTAEVANRKSNEEIAASSSNVLDAILLIFRKRLDESHHISPRFIADLQNYKTAREHFARLHDTRREEALAFLERGIEEGVFVPQTNFGVVYDMAKMMVDNVITLDLLSKMPIHEVFAATVICYIRGCTTEKGQRIIDAWLREQNK